MSVQDSYVTFLQWALPKMHMQWKGFKKVRGQVIKKLKKRLDELEIENPDSYRFYIMQHPEEWKVLDRFCRITISCFYRDKGIMNHVRQNVLPELCRNSIETQKTLKILSIGAASGEEAYSISLMLWIDMLPIFPQLRFEIEGLEISQHMIKRAMDARYPLSSLNNIPNAWLEKAFLIDDENALLVEKFKSSVSFKQGDIRDYTFWESYDLILCRYLVATYFSDLLQLKIFEQILKNINPGGYLVMGSHESVPKRLCTLESPSRGIYRKIL